MSMCDIPHARTLTAGYSSGNDSWRLPAACQRIEILYLWDRIVLMEQKAERYVLLSFA